MRRLCAGLALSALIVCSVAAAPIHDAASGGRLGEVRRLLDADASNIAARDESGRTSLHMAAMAGSSRVVSLLLQRGADVNSQDNDGNTPLHLAVASGAREVQRLLIEGGANVAIRNKQGRRPYSSQSAGAVVVRERPPEAPAAVAEPEAPADVDHEAPPRENPASEPPAQQPQGPVTVPRTEHTLRVTAASDPLHSRPSCLRFAAGRLYIGLPDGGLCVYNPATRKAGRIWAPAASGPVMDVRVAGDTVWWLSESPRSLVRCHLRDKAAVRYDLSAVPGPPDAVCPWPDGGALLVCAGALLHLDTASGIVSDADDALPPDLARAVRSGARLTADGDGRTGLVVVSRRGVTPACAFRFAEGRWADAVPLPADASRVFGGADGLSALGAGQASGESTGWRYGRLSWNSPTPVASEGEASVPIQVAGWANSAVGNSRNVWSFGSEGMLFHLDAVHGAMEAWMPWNAGAPGRIDMMAPCRDGVWMATDKGIRRFPPERPTQARGWDGYVRVTLGAASAVPPGARHRKMAALIEEWQGVPYRWGGSTRQGTDCSGFVMAMYRGIGITLPHGSAALRGTNKGRVVRGELRFGDVLIFPGHAALYIGDGRTAETVRSAVGHNSIWSRRQVVVKRLL